MDPRIIHNLTWAFRYLRKEHGFTWVEWAVIVILLTIPPFFWGFAMNKNIGVFLYVMAGS